MKLFILTSRFPYPIEKGDKLRLYYQIKVLANYHQIILCALSEYDVPQKDIEALQPFCDKIYTFKRNKFQIGKNLLLAGIKGNPFQIGYFYDKSIHRQITTVIETEKPDHIYVQLIRVAPYLKDIDIPKTIDFMDTFSIGAVRWANKASFWLKPILNREARLLAKYEATVFEQFEHHTIISSQDRAFLRFDKKDRIHIIPNGVDTSFFTPLPNVVQKYDIAFVGNMGYRPNVEAARYLVEEVLPLLIKQYPNIKILIAGARPTPLVKRLASKQITVSGWIDDIRMAYAEAKMIAAPLFIGMGQQNKILEAMAMGTPCITTTMVNNAIGAKPNYEILLADNPNEFVQQINKILTQPMLQENIRAAGLKFVRDNFSWNFFVDELNKLFIE